MKQFLLLAVLLLSTTVLTAQVRRNSPANDSINTAKPVVKTNKKTMMRELDLNKIQRAKIKELNQEQKQAREAIQNNDSLTAPEKATRLKHLNKQRAEKLQDILTTEQEAKMKALIKEKKKQKG